MNAVFTVILLLSALLLALSSPESFLSSALAGATKAATLSLALLSSYAVWLGLMNVWKESGLTSAFSRFLKKPVKKLFRIEGEEAAETVSMNLAANMLGIGGAATPYGKKAASLLENEKNGDFSSSMLFVVNATSLQLVPTSVIAMRANLQSAAPADILLPTILSTAFSSILGVLLVFAFLARRRALTRSPA